MRTYKVAIVVDVQADDYDTACELAAEFLDTADYDSAGIVDAVVELNFEEDGSEMAQRVLYLPNVNDVEEEEDIEDLDEEDDALDDLAELE